MGDAILAVSLFLPAATGQSGDDLPGWMAFVVGCYWYPSNLVLIISPLLFSQSLNKNVRIFFGSFLLLSLVFTIWFLLLTANVKELGSGFYVWLSAFAVSGIALVASLVEPSALIQDSQIVSNVHRTDDLPVRDSAMPPEIVP